MAPDHIQVIRGDGQIGIAGTELPEVLEVRVVDWTQEPVAGVEVSWWSESAGGTITALERATDREGIARARWSLGPAAGRQVALVKAAGLSVEFEAVVRAAEPATIRVSEGADQVSAPGAELARPLRITVEDAFGNPVTGVATEWEVVSGEGTLLPTTVTTNRGGYATVSWRLGPTPGLQSVRVHAGTASATFVAEAQIPTIVDDDPRRTGLAGHEIAPRPGVRLLDDAGRPMVGVRVHWTLVSGGGEIGGESADASDSSVTDELGRVRGRWRLGSEIGVQRAEARTGTARAAVEARAVPPAAFDLDPDGGGRFHEGPTDYSLFVRPHGDVRALMLLVDFDDAPAHESQGEIHDVYVPDMIDYFDGVSRGRLRLSVDLFPEWVRAPGRLDSYGVTGPGASLRSFALLSDVLPRIDARVDFSKYRLVYLVVPWDNPYTGNSPNRAHAVVATPGFGIDTSEGEVRAFAYAGNASFRSFKTLVHETYHLFGLPDLYSYEVPSHSVHKWDFVGNWDPMSNSSFGGSPFAWHLLKLGWIDPEDVYPLEEGGVEVDLQPLAMDGGPKATIFRTGASTALVMEYRAKVGLDGSICQTGLLVYEVDATIPTGRGPVRIVPAVPAQTSSGVCGTYARAPFGSVRSMVHPGSGTEATVVSVGEVLRVGAHRSIEAAAQPAARAAAPVGWTEEVVEREGRVLIH